MKKLIKFLEVKHTQITSSLILVFLFGLVEMLIGVGINDISIIVWGCTFIGISASIEVLITWILNKLGE